MTFRNSCLAHTLTIFSLVILPLLDTAHAQTPNTNGLASAVKQRLLALSTGDQATWTSLTTKDAFFVNDAGSVLQISAMAKSVPRNYPDVVSNVQDLVIRQLGNGAVVSYSIQERETFPSGPVERTLRRTETWVHQDGRWQMLAGQATIVPLMHWPSVTLDSKLLDAYVGRYQQFPGRIDTVSREGNKLYAQWTGDEKEELFALTTDTFFARDDASFMIFVRGPDNRVTHYVYRFWDGQGLTAIKLP